MNSNNTVEPVVTAAWARRLGETRADLLHIADRWPDLYQLRLPGTATRHTTGYASLAARRARDAQARAERRDRTTDTLGYSAAPLDVEVLDTLTDILVGADELAGRIAATAGAPVLDPPSTAYDYAAIRGYLIHAGDHLADAADVDPEALDDAQDTARSMRRKLDKALNEIADGHRLDTVCAFCGGATPEAPAGGERTLVVRVVVDQLVIVCANALCSPTSADCGTWVRGRPAWPEAEWEWLNKRLDMPA
ncbi:hypothetical protein [Streptomonospora wellingtoniae]|uniref:HNH endonuclease n=1 Tax=Streptomonospora wellingtoniae TaxID=3075544 RepID=A0ABU2KUG0_9ACTN|nr:hypothetical protein [Streptomonospora sp. DSM 45055]MDT0302919.1 hypothetical protein [Streptomonospora sp. DSM 45055]